MVSVPRCLVMLGLAGLLGALSACSSRSDPEQKDKDKGFLLTGKVIYSDGEQEAPVKYGFVVLFPMDGEKRVKASDGRLPAHGKIDTEGRYAVLNAPKGMVKICVLTDPDLDPHKFMELLSTGLKEKKAELF